MVVVVAVETAPAAWRHHTSPIAHRPPTSTPTVQRHGHITPPPTAPPPASRSPSPTNINTHGSGNCTRSVAAWPHHNTTHCHTNHAVAHCPSPTNINTHGGG